MSELMAMFGEVADTGYYAREKLKHHVSQRMLAAIERKNISMLEIARRLGKHKSFISQVLKGDRNMTLGTVADICEAADLEVVFEVRGKSHFSEILIQKFDWEDVPETHFKNISVLRSVAANDAFHKQKYA